MILSFEFKVGSELKLSWDKADQPPSPLGEGLWAGECERSLWSGETSAPLGFGLYQLADEALCKCWPDQNGAEAATVLFSKKERKHLQILSWCWAGTACCFSSWVHSGPAPNWSEWFPETNAFERYFPSLHPPLPREILVFSHPYYKGWVSKLCFNHSCFQRVS